MAMSCATSAAIADIRGVMVNGRCDFQTPLGTAWELHRAWPAGELVVVDDAGHGANRAGIAAELIRATDRFARRS